MADQSLRAISADPAPCLEELKRSITRHAGWCSGKRSTANSKELGGRSPSLAPADLGDLSGSNRDFKARSPWPAASPSNLARPTRTASSLQHDHHPGLHRRLHGRKQRIVFSIRSIPLGPTSPHPQQLSAVPEDLPWFQIDVTWWLLSPGACAGKRVAQVVADPGYSPSPGPTGAGVPPKSRAANSLFRSSQKGPATPGIAS